MPGPAARSIQIPLRSHIIYFVIRKGQKGTKRDKKGQLEILLLPPPVPINVQIILPPQLLLQHRDTYRDTPSRLRYPTFDTIPI